MSTLLHLIRHGQTDWNAAHRLQGSNDIPLNDLGLLQARSLRPFFHHSSVDAWFSSPLTRARQTLEIATTPPPGWPVLDTGFAEVGLGDLEGRLLAEVLALHGDDLWHRWWRGAKEDEDFSLAGGESPSLSNKRVREALLRISTNHDFQIAAVCTHGLLLKRFLQSLDPARSPDTRIPNAFIATIAVDTATGGIELRETFAPPALD